MPRIISDPFFRQLHARIIEEVNKRVDALVQGGSIVRGDKGLLLDPVNTATKYQVDVAVIKTYQDIIELGFEIDREVFGVKHNNDGDD